MEETIETKLSPSMRNELPATRTCTRCDGEQHLMGEFEGLGKYVCDTCQMRVGFDVAATPVEFLISQGVPAKYTKKVFGIRMPTSEQRL